jgi:hypothetical protein
MADWYLEDGENEMDQPIEAGIDLEALLNIEEDQVVVLEEEDNVAAPEVPFIIGDLQRGDEGAAVIEAADPAPAGVVQPLARDPLGQPDNNEEGRQPSPPPMPLCLQRPHYRIRTAGFLWMLGEYFYRRGHLYVSNEDVAFLRTWVSPLHSRGDPIPIILLTWHSLATTRGAETTLHAWANRVRRVDTRLTSPTNRWSPALNPWARPDCWTIGAWSLCTQVIRRFLRQPQPAEEEVFRRCLSDLYADAEGEYWVIGFISMTLYFIESAMYVWEATFCAQDR